MHGWNCRLGSGPGNWRLLRHSGFISPKGRAAARYGGYSEASNRAGGGRRLPLGEGQRYIEQDIGGHQLALCPVPGWGTLDPNGSKWAWTHAASSEIFGSWPRQGQPFQAGQLAKPQLWWVGQNLSASQQERWGCGTVARCWDREDILARGPREPSAYHKNRGRPLESTAQMLTRARHFETFRHGARQTLPSAYGSSLCISTSTTSVSRLRSERWPQAETECSAH